MKLLRYATGATFIVAGGLHFVIPSTYRAIMPPWIPRHGEAVAVSGIAEIAGGVAMFSPRTSRLGGAWLIALLVAVFPANLHMAMNPEQIRGLADRGIPTWAFWLRLPLQPLAIALVWLVTKPTVRAGRG